MHEKPDIREGKLIACLQEAFGLPAVRVDFLPLGADVNTAVYRASAEDGAAFFVKLRRGVFDETSVGLPKWLHDQGAAQIIAPMMAQSGRLWAELDAYKVILYPFLSGRDGYKVKLSESQWCEFGAALKRIHSAVVPPALLRPIQRETFLPQWRESVRIFLARVEAGTFDEPVAVKAAAFLRAKRTEIQDLVGRAEQYARALLARPQEYVLCHSDLHAGNLLIAVSGAFYIVDWDQPILAPKERDLMFIGGGQGFTGTTAEEEETLFYSGYGPARIDPTALAYYRYERIIQDIAAFCEQIFLTDAGGEDREQGYQYLVSNFLPNGTIEIAYRADKTRGESNNPIETSLTEH